MLDSTREKLKRTSTPTIATLLFKLGLKNQFIQNVKPVKTGKPTMVGEAFTLRYIPAREDLNPITVFRDPKHPQRVAVETCPEGAVMVMDSRKSARAASAGSILITRLMKRGAAGVVTDGGFRDSGIIADLDFASFHSAPSAPTNLTLNQAMEINIPIGCGDVAVYPGDVILGDDDGVMVIPAHLADQVADEASGMELYEEFVTNKVLEGAPVIGLYPLTDEAIKEEFETWKSDKK
ncbi:ribonuclease activity regulator RraA [Lutimonas halocynthiae]|uniref:ribonuclease activity regulator RraA n=1 Tax=Lutimonas halocynthiae TaxID=1446477 RepID=UPI0025B535C0|nr:ribonuclease activity regulator RraA [Lutimonas halocynthiae]MDN3643267.1 ribonuclease activity regulator RraA [Lutimonas halocynthiae]